ncbi:11871_t:CDS:2 [Ambispora leptoticha]|uniref:11871_t:CDS:1 n=1 Tax=Ambispora leptoticha TaxID=144679 RepID=A0A9N8ZUM9_9GLOM|nr:11871_t:CDS:2 [Ambispora leptoticha]
MPPHKIFKKKTASQTIKSINFLSLRYKKDSIVRKKTTPSQPITKFFERISRKIQPDDAKNIYRLNQFGFSSRQESESLSPSASPSSQQRKDSGIEIDFDTDYESNKDNGNSNAKQKQKSIASDTTEILPPADAIRKVIEENLLELTDIKNNDSIYTTVPMRPSSLGYNLINIIPVDDYNPWFVDENGNKRYSLWKLAGCRDDITKTIDFHQYEMKNLLQK